MSDNNLKCAIYHSLSLHARTGQPPPGELYWTHHWQKNFTIPELSTKQTTERWEDEDRFPEDNVSDTSSRDYPRLYLESDYGQRTDRENDLDTDLERVDKEREKRISSRSCIGHSRGNDPYLKTYLQI